MGPKRCHGWIGAAKLPMVDFPRAPTDVWELFSEGLDLNSFFEISGVHFGVFWPILELLDLKHRFRMTRRILAHKTRALELVGDSISEMFVRSVDDF